MVDRKEPVINPRISNIYGDRFKSMPIIRGSYYIITALARSLAIGSLWIKLIMKFIASSILTEDAWIFPGQWETDWRYLLLCPGIENRRHRYKTSDTGGGTQSFF